MLHEATDEECTGQGNCHGCLWWCTKCGDVAHVCDMRLRGERCDEHPVPPTKQELSAARAEAERLIREGERLKREGARELQRLLDEEAKRRAYDAQLREQEKRDFYGT